MHAFVRNSEFLGDYATLVRVARCLPLFLQTLAINVLSLDLAIKYKLIFCILIAKRAPLLQFLVKKIERNGSKPAPENTVLKK